MSLVTDRSCEKVERVGWVYGLGYNRSTVVS